MERFLRKMRRLFVGLLLVILCTFFVFYSLRKSEFVREPLSSDAYQEIFYAKSAEWTWQCSENECKKSKSAFNNSRRGDAIHSTSDMVMSLLTCSMICGSAKIWPMPTKQMSLSKSFVRFEPSNADFSMVIGHGEKQASAYGSTISAYLNSIWTIFRTNQIKKASSLYPHRYFSGHENNVNKATKFLVNITVRTNEEKLELKTNESYWLRVQTRKQQRQEQKKQPLLRSREQRLTDTAIVVNIVAETIFGARHALETLNQLIWIDEYSEFGHLYILKMADILDAPKFAYRGLMLDTARNFFNVDAIKRTLDGMAINKLNVFHWHVSDSQSFPLRLKSEPRLVTHGSYDPYSMYTESDVADIRKFAYLRGIRVLIEIDVPAHAGRGWEWGPQAGLGDLAVCVAKEPWSSYCGEPPCGQLNPFNENVYSVLKDIYDDLFRLTDERELFHLGGDEVNFNCWEQYRREKWRNFNENNDEEQQQQQRQGKQQQQTNININSNQGSNKNMYESIEIDYFKVWLDFHRKQLKSVREANQNQLPSHLVIWSSELTKSPLLKTALNDGSADSVRSRVVVQSWGSSEWTETADLISSGFQVILSHVDAWYLDCGFGNWKRVGDAACQPYRSWQTVYQHRPWTNSLLNISMILGGEACLWTEQVNEFSLDLRLWPRAAALAERLWSDIESTPTSSSYGDGSFASQGSQPGYGPNSIVHRDVFARLELHRQRLIDSGLRAEAISPKWCQLNPNKCL